MQPGTGLTTQIRADEDGLMLKEIIYGRLALSRGLLRRMKSGGAVRLNGEHAYITQRGRQGDRLDICFADSPTQLEPEALDLDIVFEDPALLLINKPAGMAVHPTASYPRSTVANALAHLWQRRGYQRRVRLLHRLDRDTSGLLLVAKEPYAYQRLAQQWREASLLRTYLAVVPGTFPYTGGRIDQPIGRHSGIDGHSLRRTVAADGKPALTNYRLVQHYRGCSLLELHLETGRTHQIRVHLQWLGFPLLGDEMYGGNTAALSRQALHAHSIRFAHPRSGEILQIRAPLPDDLVSLLKARKVNNTYG